MHVFLLCHHLIALSRIKSNHSVVHVTMNIVDLKHIFFIPDADVGLVGCPFVLGFVVFLHIVYLFFTERILCVAYNVSFVLNMSKWWELTHSMK